MKRTKILLPAAILGCLITMAASDVMAQGSAADAVARYKKGRALIEQKQYEEALAELDASYSLLDSPNTLLLMAHAERELGRETIAARHYERVIEEAESRVQRGEARFEKTAADAKEWLDKLTKTLGRLTVVVTNAPEGAVVRVDGDAVSAEKSGDSLRVNSVWWKPGTAVVQVVAGDRSSRKVTAEIPAGGPASLSIDFEADAMGSDSPAETAPTNVSPETTEDSGGRGVPTATWVTGGIGLAGLATFGLFGSMAKSKSSDLDACSPSCPESERPTADAGKRDQTIANIGLVVGGVGLLTAAGFYFLQPSNAEQEPGTVHVSVGPQSVMLHGTFR
jgi:hypothetical protein